MIKKIIKIGFTISLACSLVVFVHYFRKRYIPHIKFYNYEKLSFKAIEGYTDKLSYKLFDTISISINAKEYGKAYITKDNIVIDSFLINKKEQKFNDSFAEFGCNWNTTKSLVLKSKYTPGYYTIEYRSKTDISYSNFIIENHSKSKIAILAPISTWVSYNDWGGKSLYKNYYEAKTVYYVSSKRPFQNPINKAESNISKFFIENYNATLVPDYYLETHRELLKNYDIIILAYHCEYFSEKMYESLNYLIKEEKKSHISLGANQIYWKTKWNSDYTIMECRKDLTSFSNSIIDYGGMWRHHINRSEHNLLGVRFTESGMHSYAPYQVKEYKHWIFNNLDVNNQTIFGLKGVNGLPISGSETDKMVSLKSNMTLLAKGLNCTGQNNNYISIEDNCDNNSGADFIIIENKDYDVLSTGSIESGAGLGKDKIFTGMIKNFIKKNTSDNKK